MNANDLKVIQGGLSTEIEYMQKEFVEAYVTDTRMMGVLAIHATWKASPAGSSGTWKALHQFFYIDCEEAGFEMYKAHFDDPTYEVAMTEQAIFGGLGANKVPLTLHTLKGLLSFWLDFNYTHDLPLPKGFRDFRFLVDPPTILTSQEQKLIMREISGDITTPYQVINYFLMRCFGRDYEGARWLTASVDATPGQPLKDDFPLDLYDKYVKASFCRNVIDESKTYGDSSKEYLCESLVEMNGKYDSIISKVVLNADNRVIGFEHCSSFRVSSAEAAMMLAKPEFTSVYEVLLDDETLDENLGEFTIGLNTVMSRKGNGRLFMAFKTNNAHVDEQTFVMSNDVNGVYYLTDFGQLIVVAYDSDSIARLETKLFMSPLSPYLRMTGRYEFMQPLLMEFINSDFDDFQYFLEVLESR